MNSFKKIIENQEKFKDEIINFFSEEFNVAKKELNSIKTDDDYIIKQKVKLKNKFKKVNIKKQIEQLFFLHPKRNESFYVFWDEKENDAKILKYDKK